MFCRVGAVYLLLSGSGGHGAGPDEEHPGAHDELDEALKGPETLLDGLLDGLLLLAGGGQVGKVAEAGQKAPVKDKKKLVLLFPCYPFRCHYCR